MKKLALAALLVGLFTACSDEKKVTIFDAPGSASDVCNPLMQTGCAANEKCTWLLDAIDPQYVGHVGCAPKSDEDVDVDGACQYGTPGQNGFDNCKAGNVCSDFTGKPGFCKQICNQSGMDPKCDDDHACATYTNLFYTGDNTPHAAGVCDHICDPMADNDYDGSASSGPAPAFAKRGTQCGSAENQGCYGGPSLGTAPPTHFTCTRDYNYAKGVDEGLRHRAQCTVETGCIMKADEYFLNACNQGYLALIQESTEVSTRICVALCKPTNCYSGNCGVNGANELGIAGDSCAQADRIYAGTGIPPNFEHCQYFWYNEINRDDGTFLPSKYSNSTGFCYSHEAYKYNKDGDADTGVNGREEPLPNCRDLQDGIGSGSAPSDPDYFGAAELGCVDTTHAGLGSAAVGKAMRVSDRILNKVRAIDMPRPPYSRDFK